MPAIEVKLRRGTSSQHAGFAGAEGEVTVDRTINTLVVHDGVTLGGFPLARQDLSNISDLATDLIPAQDNTYSIGSATRRWKDIFVGANTIHIGSTLQLSGTTITIASDANSTNLGQMPTLVASRLVAKPYTYNPGGGNVTVRPVIEFQDSQGNSYPISFNTASNEFSLDAMGNYGTGSLVARKLTLSNDGATGLSLIGNQTHDGNYTNTQTDKTFRFDGDVVLGFDAARTLTIKSTASFQSAVSYTAGLNVAGEVVLGDGNDNVTINAGSVNPLVITSSSLTLSSAGNATLPGNLTVGGSLTVSGTTNLVNSNEVNIGDNILVLNADIPGTLDPTENAGIQVARGTGAAVRWIWDETFDYWSPAGGNIGNVGSLTATSLVGPLTGNASTATRLATARKINGTDFDGTSDITITAAIAHSLIRGTFLTGSDFNGLATTTWAVDATSDNTASKVVARDGSGNFAAGTITASLAGNAATASKLATPRTVSLAGDVEGSTNFDGSGNITITAVLADTAVTPGTYGSVTVDAKGRVTAGTNPSASLTSGDITTALGYTPANRAGDTFTGAVTATAFTGPLSGNASTATRLETSRTLSVSGDATGSASFDGSANATIAVTLAGKGTANGLATLDSSGKVVSTQLPAIAVTDTFVVASQAEMLAVTAQTGDVAVRTDLSKSFILKGASASTLADWQELLTPSNGVGTVFGRTGAVVATAGDYTADQITATPAGTLAAVTVQAALAELDTEKAGSVALTGDVTGTATVSAGAVSLATTLANAGTAGTYTKVTTDAKGRVTSGSSPTTLSGYGITDAQPLDADLTAVAGLTGTGLAVRTAADTWATRTLTGTTNRISVTNGSGAAGNPTIDLATSGVTGGTYNSVTVDTYGRVTAASNVAYQTGNQSITLSGDATGSGTTAITLTLADSGAVAGTYRSVTVDAKGRVTAGTNPALTSGEVTTALGYTPVNPTDATSANTASKIVQRDASGNFSAGTITASLTGNASTATKLASAVTINGTSFDGSGAISITANTPATLTRGNYLTGSNFNGSTATTWAVDATALNTASKVVTRDGSGNFAAGTITAALTGNASTATRLETSRTLGLSGDATGSASFDGSANATIAVTLANKGTANGLATLDSSGKVVASQLPAIAITDTHVVGSQAAMLALTAETGDVAVRTDLSKSFILKGTSAATLADWQELLTPSDGVGTVFGRTGAVVATAGDYTAGQITFTPAGSIAAVTVQAAIAELDTEKQPLDADLTAVAALSGTGLAVRTAADTWTTRTLTGTTNRISVTNGNGVSGNPTIDLAASGVGTGGTYNTVTVDTYGRVTAGSNTSYLTANQSITVSGDASGSGTTAIALTLANSGAVAGTYQSVTVDAKGRVTSGAALTASDLPASLDSTARTTVRVNTGTDTGSRRRLNFIAGTGMTVAATDDSVAEEIDITITANNTGTVTSVASGTGLTGGPIVGTGTLSLTGQALALHNLATNGLIARTGAGTVAGRTLTGTTNRISVTNGDGVSGNPTVDLATSGVAAGTYTSVTVDTYGRVTAASNPASSITSSDVTTALGYTPLAPADATSANTASKIVQRDASGNFVAGTITAALTGNASTATKLASPVTINGTSFDGSGNITISASDGTKLPLAGGTMSGAITLSGDPTADLHAVPRQWVEGRMAKDSCRVATTANLTATAATQTLTNSGTLAALAIDGVTLTTADRVLVKNQTTGAQNGIYVVTNTGSASVAWVLTRATGMNTWADIPAAVTAIEEGTTNTNTMWFCTNTRTGTLGTTAIGWQLVSNTQVAAIGNLATTGFVNRTGTNTFTTTAGATANTASTLVLRDASGNFSAGTITASLSGNATSANSADTLSTARLINGTSFNGSADITITANTANTLTRGTYLTGNNFNGSAATTWAVDATNLNTASKVVARDASGNFSAGTITAALSGNATTATTLQTARLINGVSFNGSADITISGSDSTKLPLAGGTLTGNVDGTTFRGGAGSATAPTFSFTGDTNTGMYSGGADILRFTTAGSDKVTILANGDINVGGATMVTNAEARYLTVKGRNSGLGYASLRMQSGLSTNEAFIQCVSSTADIQMGTPGGFSFQQNGTFRFGIHNTSGDMMIGTNGTTTPGYSTGSGFIGSSLWQTGRVFINQSDFSNWGMNKTGVLVGFTQSGTSTGNITITGSTTAYNTTSDYRLKQDVEPIGDALERLSLLKPSRFAFKIEPSKRVDGFIAHEVEPVVPEAVTGQHNETDFGGNPVYQSMDPGKLVPLLTAALQEAVAKIADLTARVEALEAV